MIFLLDQFTCFIERQRMESHPEHLSFEGPRGQSPPQEHWDTSPGGGRRVARRQSSRSPCEEVARRRAGLRQGSPTVCSLDRAPSPRGILFLSPLQSQPPLPRRPRAPSSLLVSTRPFLLLKALAPSAAQLPRPSPTPSVSLPLGSRMYVPSAPIT